MPRKTHLLFHRLEFLPEHPIGMELAAFEADGRGLLHLMQDPIGGGFLVNQVTERRRDPAEPVMISGQNLL